MNTGTSRDETVAYNKVALLNRDDLRQKVWHIIMADKGRVQKGWGLTNHTIKRGGYDFR